MCPLCFIDITLSQSGLESNLHNQITDVQEFSHVPLNFSLSGRPWKIPNEKCLIPQLLDRKWMLLLQCPHLKQHSVRIILGMVPVEPVCFWKTEE